MSAAATATRMTKFEKYTKNYKGVPKTIYEEEDLQPGLTYQDFDNMLSGKTYSYQLGEVVTGSVFELDGKKGALVDIGAKSSAFLPLREASLMPVNDVSECLGLGDTREFQIISDENADGQMLVSLRRLEFGKAWDKSAADYAEDKTFECEILQVNRGGAMVSVNGLRAFLPGSHCAGFICTEDIVGNMIRVKYLECDSEAKRIVVSNRRAVMEESSAELKRGELIEGRVTSVKPYGAFIELKNGLSGLLHISQISFDRVTNVEDVLTINSSVKCMVMDQDKAKNRIALSTKTLEAEPGDMLRDKEKVFENAEETAKVYLERLEEEKKAREEAA